MGSDHGPCYVVRRMENRIETISFDLWDTVVIDDSDEPKRAAQGFPPKPVARRDLVQRFVEKHEAVPRPLIDAVYTAADSAFRRVWYGQSVTWTVRERLGVVLDGIGRQLPDDEMDELVRLHEEMEVEIMPDLVPGIREALEALRGQYKLAVISDAIFSPGRSLRRILKKHDLYDFFDCFVFSDEIGCSKPDPRCFEKVAQDTGCSVDKIVHLGDREQKDIDGPMAVGARGVLVPIAIDRGTENTRAAAVCRDYKDLPSILEALGGATR